MDFDYSEKGRKKFYDELFSKLESLASEGGDDISLLKKTLASYINTRKIYESSCNGYKSQLNSFWALKKTEILNEYREKMILGVSSSETKNRKEKIKKFEDFLRNLSSTFDEDLEEVMNRDPDVIKTNKIYKN